MKRFVEGEDRAQITLLPECLDDYIAEDNPVRVVEVFVDELDLGRSASTVSIPRRRAGRHTTRRCCSRFTSTATSIVSLQAGVLNASASATLN